jgi:hypothetical protein
MKTLRIMVFAAFVFCMGVSMAGADDHVRKGACKADFEKFCKDVKPGQGRIVNCMKQHEAELSAACRDQIADTREKAQDFTKACRADYEKICKDVKPGQGRIIRCLKAHETILSPACAAYFKK